MSNFKGDSTLPIRGGGLRQDYQPRSTEQEATSPNSREKVDGIAVGRI